MSRLSAGPDLAAGVRLRGGRPPLAEPISSRTCRPQARDTPCPVSPLDDSAKSWCAQDTVYRIVGGDIQAYHRAILVVEESSQALYGALIRAINDGSRPALCRHSPPR